jgi:SpoVK/Ycf46/Vps4 family AAA+-type ATPase
MLTSASYLSRRASARGSRPATLPPGIVDIRPLPDDDFTSLWDAILVEPIIKDQLLSQAILNFTLRPKISRAALPLHGIILMVGAPGTGKTSLAKGLASCVAQSFTHSGTEFRFVEVDPHALSSSSLGKTQRAVTELFGSTIVEQAALGPTIVLLDEVETIAVDRSRLSLDANPIDVHRATDAALVQLDRIANEHPNILFVATSNFPRALDSAFVSRADLVLEVPSPTLEGRHSILESTLTEMATEFRELRGLARSAGLVDVARATDGLDGRSMRKLVVAACARDRNIAMDPGGLTMQALLAAAKDAVAARLVRVEAP